MKIIPNQYLDHGVWRDYFGDQASSLTTPTPTKAR
jgi:hypothetical protein